MCFLFFWRELLMFWLPVLEWCFGGLFVSVISRLCLKGPPSSFDVSTISLISVSSIVFERLVSVRLGSFMKRSGVLPTTQFANRKCLATCDALCECPMHWNVYRRESRRQGSCRLISPPPLYQLRESQHVMVDGCPSKLVNVVPGVLQGSFLDPLLFFLYTSELLLVLQ